MSQGTSATGQKPTISRVRGKALDPVEQEQEQEQQREKRLQMANARIDADAHGRDNTLGLQFAGLRAAEEAGQRKEDSKERDGPADLDDGSRNIHAKEGGMAIPGMGSTQGVLGSNHSTPKTSSVHPEQKPKEGQEQQKPVKVRNGRDGDTDGGVIGSMSDALKKALAKDGDAVTTTTPHMKRPLPHVKVDRPAPEPTARRPGTSST